MARKTMIGIKRAAFAAGAAAISLQCAALTHVDVLVAYDTTARQWLSNEGITAESFAADQIKLSNQVLVNSKLDDAFDFRLAGVFQGAFTHQSGRNLQPTLLALTDDTGSAYRALRSERDKVGADIVMVIVSTGATSGMIGLSNGMEPSVNGERQYGLEFAQASAWLEWFSERAYGVVDAANAHGGYTFIHEMGHIMGAGHSEIISPSYDEPGPQLCRYSSAVMAQGSDGTYYATVMGYNATGYSDSAYYNVLPYFSSPDIANPDTGDALGDASHDNARTLRNTYQHVANFRSEAATVPDPAPAPAPAAEPAEFTAKKTTITAAVGNGSDVVGLAQFVIAATKKGVSKVSGTVIGLDGKKAKVKNTKCDVYSDGNGGAAVSLKGIAVKGWGGTLDVTLGSDGSISYGSMGGYSLSLAAMGISGRDAAFWIDSKIASVQGNEVVQSVIYDGKSYNLLPYSENPEPVMIGAKWSVAKAGRVKMVKDRTTKTSNLVPTGTGNMSGLKLSYQAKTGVFKGSFTAYAVVNSKLKKHKFAVTGVAVDGVGTGIAVCKKAGVTVGVTVGDPALCDECSALISE